MGSLIPLVLIVCCLQVGQGAVTDHIFKEKWGKQVAETAQERSFTCPGADGNYASPQQCVANYYQCREGIAYPQTCPPGNVFDPVTSVCTPFTQASCNQELDCSSDGLFPYPGKTVKEIQSRMYRLQCIVGQELAN
ncbi:putative Peritrophic matrix protein [Daphnia magna]|uniref:Putative Peritrophic matrix protein n=1 Tax=Daphnia magna TaxID=35525 RepID=A0A164YU02_9CRUS|nr:putative Peritrophic matrix protein [Daphnia magna]